MVLVLCRYLSYWQCRMSYLGNGIIRQRLIEYNSVELGISRVISVLYANSALQNAKTTRKISTSDVFNGGWFYKVIQSGESILKGKINHQNAT